MNMQPPATSPFLSFVHIEKAGGITLHNLWHKCFPGYLSPHPHPRFGWHLTARDLQRLQRWTPYRIQGIGGHRISANQGYEQVLRRPVFYLTFVRDPLKRYFSHINWQVAMMQMDWTMETFTADPEKDNYQAYRIAGDRYDWEKARYILSERFHFVGLLERFDESLLLLRQRMGLPELDIRYERSNVTKEENVAFRYEDQPASMQQLIRRRNEVDLRIYDYVREELFPRYIREYPGDLQRDLAMFRAQNEGYRFPRWSWVKRKATNVWLGRVVQPLIARNP